MNRLRRVLVRWDKNVRNYLAFLHRFSSLSSMGSGELIEQSRAPDVIKRAFKALGAVVSTLRTIDFIAQLPEKVRNVLSLLA